MSSTQVQSGPSKFYPVISNPSSIPGMPMAPLMPGVGYPYQMPFMSQPMMGQPMMVPGQQYSQISFPAGSLAKKVLEPLLQTGQLVPNTPQYDIYALALLTRQPIRLTGDEPRRRALIQLYKDFQGQPVQKEIFKLLYDEIQIDSQNLPHQTDILAFLNELFKNTRDTDITDWIKKIFSEGKIVLKDTQGNDKPYELFIPSKEMLPHHLPAGTIDGIEHLYLPLVSARLDEIYTEIDFFELPSTVFKELMDAFAHIMKQTGSQTTLSAERQYWVDALIQRGVTLCRVCPDVLDRLLLNQGRFSSADSIPYYKEYMRALIGQLQMPSQPMDGVDGVAPPSELTDAHFNTLIRFLENLDLKAYEFQFEHQAPARLSDVFGRPLSRNAVGVLGRPYPLPPPPRAPRVLQRYGDVGERPRPEVAGGRGALPPAPPPMAPAVAAAETEPKSSQQIAFDDYEEISTEKMNADFTKKYKDAMSIIQSFRSKPLAEGICEQILTEAASVLSEMKEFIDDSSTSQINSIQHKLNKLLSFIYQTKGAHPEMVQPIESQLTKLTENLRLGFQALNAHTTLMAHAKQYFTLDQNTPFTLNNLFHYTDDTSRPIFGPNIFRRFKRNHPTFS